MMSCNSVAAGEEGEQPAITSQVAFNVSLCISRAYPSCQPRHYHKPKRQMGLRLIIERFTLWPNKSLMLSMPYKIIVGRSCKQSMWSNNVALEGAMQKKSKSSSAFCKTNHRPGFKMQLPLLSLHVH